MSIIAWVSVALGVAVLLGVSKAINGWDLRLSFGTSQTGGQLFLFVVGLFLLVGGIVQVFSQRRPGK